MVAAWPAAALLSLRMRPAPEQTEPYLRRPWGSARIPRGRSDSEHLREVGAASMRPCFLPKEKRVQRYFGKKEKRGCSLKQAQHTLGWLRTYVFVGYQTLSLTGDAGETGVAVRSGRQLSQGSWEA